MTSTLILRKNLNPISDSSASLKGIFCLTDSSGDSPEFPAPVTYLWIPQPIGGQPFTELIMEKFTTKMMIYSDSKGYTIFDKNGPPEYSQGSGGTWSRIAVTYDTGNITNLDGGYYNVTFENLADVIGPASSTDNTIARYDGTTGKIIQGTTSGSVTYDDNGAMTITGSKAGYLLDVHNSRTSGGGNGVTIKSGEVLGDISLRISDANNTVKIMEMEADKGHVTMGKTYAQTLADNGTVYGMDIQHAGVASDFNTQTGVYRIGGTNVVSVPQTLTNKTITDSSNNVTANSVRSTTTSVNLSSATAPSAGQVLTATSSTAATWQDPTSSVFGSQYQYISSESESSTTSSSFQTKTTLTTISLPSGTYRLGYSYELSNSSNKVCEAMVELDSTTVSLSTFKSEDDYHAMGGFIDQSLNGVVTARIRYRTPSSGTSSIRRSRLELQRIA